MMQAATQPTVAPARRARMVAFSPALLGTAALLLAVYAQRFLERHPDTPYDSLLLFAVSVALWLAAMWRVPPAIDHTPAPVVPGPRLSGRRQRALLTSLSLLALTLLVWPVLAGPMGGGLGILAYPGGPGDARGELTTPGLILWLAGVAAYLVAVVDGDGFRARLGRRIRGLARREVLIVCLAVVLVTVAAAWLRLYDLNNLPREMTSDHTEKLLDIRDILNGWHPVFLPGNAGREPLQFYWTALLVSLGLPLSFFTLKLGMAIVSILTVPPAYWAGREVGGRTVGIATAGVLALVPWHLQIARQSLRIGLAPLFACLALALTLRALRTGRRNDWLALGFVLGTGLYGYTGFRTMLIAAPVIVALRLGHDLWQRHGGARAVLSPSLLGHLTVAAGLTIVIAAPLARYAVDRPDAFWYRTRTRMSGLEQPLAHPAAEQFAINMKNGLLMFNRLGDSAWFNSPPQRPALETIAGALLVLGVATAAARAVRGDWRTAGVLLTVPIMLLSSVMALAFPLENPSLARAAGALPAVVILAALPLAPLRDWWQRVPRRVGATVYVVLVTGLFVAMGIGARQRLFTEYRAGYDNATHPAWEAANVAKAFQALGGNVDHVYLVGWPHAWDYRAVAIEMGAPTWRNVLFGTQPDFANAAEEARQHQADPARKLYLVGGTPEVARRNLSVLKGIYPGAVLTRHEGHVAGKEFFSVFVAETGEAQGAAR